jgi:cysteine synthase A
MATIAVVTCSAVAIIAIIIFLVLLVNGVLFNRGETTVKVPNLVGEYYDNIRDTQGLDITIGDYKHSETVAKDKVISKTPAYGAEVVLTPGADGMAGSIDKAAELAATIPGSFIPGQFENPANALAHYRTTGPEIWAQTDGNADIFVAGVGTGGTITGTARYLKEKDPAIRIVAVEPAKSPLLSLGQAGSHGIQGIGANFVPKLLDRSLLDEVMTVTDEEAFAAAKELARRFGILCGISSGANYHAAAAIAATNPEKTVVTLPPDSGTRYLSTGIFG